MSMDNMPRAELAPGYTISRIIKGGWQLAGGHGRIDPDRAVADMRRFVEAGITTFDAADIYTGVEELIGRFIRRERAALASGALPPVQVHTKFVPDLSALPTLTRRDIQAVIDRSLRRLGVERIDLVQFHWWDFGVPGWTEAAAGLDELRRAGKIRLVGVTNFDAARLETLLDDGIPVVSDQVQYSVLDSRPETALVDLCRRRSLSLLVYGAVAGGFLSGRWLDAPPPDEPLENRSLVKYRVIIEEFGGWDRFQEMLRVLQTAARPAGLGIAEAALRYALDRDRVAAVIVGARHARFLPGLGRAADARFRPGDARALRALAASAPGPRGAVYELERDRTGPHGRIMKYNLGGSGHAE